MKRCPFCAEEIQDDAVKCRYCGEWLPIEEKKNEKKATENEAEIPRKTNYGLAKSYAILTFFCISICACIITWACLNFSTIETDISLNKSLTYALHFLNLGILIFFRMLFVYLKYSLIDFNYSETIIKQTKITSEIFLGVFIILLLNSMTGGHLVKTSLGLAFSIILYVILLIALVLLGWKLSKYKDETLPVFQYLGYSMLALIIFPPTIIAVPIILYRIFESAEKKQQI